MNRRRLWFVVLLALIGGAMSGITAVYSRNHVFPKGSCRQPFNGELPGVYLCGPPELFEIWEWNQDDTKLEDA